MADKSTTGLEEDVPFTLSLLLVVFCPIRRASGVGVSFLETLIGVSGVDDDE